MQKVLTKAGQRRRGRAGGSGARSSQTAAVYIIDGGTRAIAGAGVAKVQVAGHLAV